MTLIDYIRHIVPYLLTYGGLGNGQKERFTASMCGCFSLELKLFSPLHRRQQHAFCDVGGYRGVNYARPAKFIELK